MWSLIQHCSCFVMSHWWVSFNQTHWSHSLIAFRSMPRCLHLIHELHLQPLSVETMALCSANMDNQTGKQANLPPIYTETPWAGEEKAIWPKDQRGWTLNFYTIGSVNYWRDWESCYNLLQVIGCYAEWKKGCSLLQKDWLDTLLNEFLSDEHRLQLFRNLQDSPGFLAIILGTWKAMLQCIVGPEWGPDTSINTCMVLQLMNS